MICQKCNAALPATAPLPLCWGCTVGMAGRDELSQWLTALPQGGGTAMLGMPVQPMELAADGRTATASFIVGGVLEGHGTVPSS